MSAPSRPAASRAKPSAASTASALKLTGDDQYNPDVKLRTSPATSRVGRAGQATVSNESMADKIAREAMMKRRARESAMSGEGMKKGGSVKGWGIARGSRKAKNY